MKKTALALALVFVLIPSVSSAATDEQIRASLTQQLLSMFVVQVNSLDKIQSLVAQSSNPSQFDTFSGLVAAQLSATTAQLSTLLNPSGASIQAPVGGVGVEPLGTQPLGSAISTVPTITVQITEGIDNRGILGGNCEIARITAISNVVGTFSFVNPENGSIQTSLTGMFRYKPTATSTIQTVQVSINGLATTTVPMKIIGSLLDVELEKDPTGDNRLSKSSTTYWTDKGIGYPVNPLTGLCI